MGDGALWNITTFLPDYAAHVPAHRNIHVINFMLKYPNTSTELIVFACAGKVTAILMQQFHFSLPLLTVRKFGIISSRTLRWKNTQNCLNTVPYMRGRWRYLVEKITSNAILYCLASRHGFYFPLCWSQTRLYWRATVHSDCHVSPRLGICTFAFHLTLTGNVKKIDNLGDMFKSDDNIKVNLE
jgi:hypothetical protein